MKMKTCLNCGKKFRFRKKFCSKNCGSLYWNKTHKEKVREIDRLWRKNNCEKKRISDKLYYLKNKEKIDEYKKGWAKKNKEKIRESGKRFYRKWKKRHKVRTEATRLVKIPKNKLCEEYNERLAVQRHHEDYSKPLEVKFVCIPCHSQIHTQNAN